MTYIFSAYKLPRRDEVTYETLVVLSMAELSNYFEFVILAGCRLGLLSA